MKTLKILTCLWYLSAMAGFAQDPHSSDENFVDRPPRCKNASVVQLAYAAFDKQDMPAFLRLLDDDIVWNEADGFPYADNNPYVGKSAVLNGVFARIGADWDYFNISDLCIYGMYDNMILATGYYNGRHKHTLKTIKVQMAHLWWLDNGKLIRFQQFADTKQASDAVRQ